MMYGLGPWLYPCLLTWCDRAEPSGYPAPTGEKQCLALGHEQPPGEFPGGSMRMLELLTTVDSHHPLGAAASLHFWQGGAAPDPIPCSPLPPPKIFWALLGDHGYRRRDA